MSDTDRAIILEDELHDAQAEIRRLRSLNAELVEVLTAFMDSRAPDYAEAARPGIADRARALLEKVR